MERMSRGRRPPGPQDPVLGAHGGSDAGGGDRRWDTGWTDRTTLGEALGSAAVTWASAPRGGGRGGRCPGCRAPAGGAPLCSPGDSCLLNNYARGCLYRRARPRPPRVRLAFRGRPRGRLPTRASRCRPVPASSGGAGHGQGPRAGSRGVRPWTQGTGGPRPAAPSARRVPQEGSPPSLAPRSGWGSWAWNWGRSVRQSLPSRGGRAAPWGQSCGQRPGGRGRTQHSPDPPSPRVSDDSVVAVAVAAGGGGGLQGQKGPTTEGIWPLTPRP